MLPGRICQWVVSVLQYKLFCCVTRLGNDMRSLTLFIRTTKRKSLFYRRACIAGKEVKIAKLSIPPSVHFTRDPYLVVASVYPVVFIDNSAPTGSWLSANDFCSRVRSYSRHNLKFKLCMLCLGTCSAFSLVFSLQWVGLWNGNQAGFWIRLQSAIWISSCLSQQAEIDVLLKGDTICEKECAALHWKSIA